MVSRPSRRNRTRIGQGVGHLSPSGTAGQRAVSAVNEPTPLGIAANPTDSNGSCTADRGIAPAVRSAPSGARFPFARDVQGLSRALTYLLTSQLVNA